MAKATKNLDRCHISSECVSKLTDGEWAVGEGFWITLVNDDEAIVENILLCGLGVGDRIRIRSGDTEEHRNEFVEVIERKSKVMYFQYRLEGYNTLPDKFPSRAIAFMKILEELHIRCEPMAKGFLAIQCPLDMEDEQLLQHINCGPFLFDAK